MTLELVMPDVIKIVVGFLRAQTEVTDLCGDEKSIRGALAKGTIFPAIKATRIASEPVHTHPHIVESVRVQLDCWGGNNRQAERLAQTCVAALSERIVGYENDEGTVTRIFPRGVSDLADDSFEPVRERYVAEIEIWVKPLVD